MTTDLTVLGLTATSIALKDLTLHELNARAASPETYADDDIAILAASIAALGLLNPLIVQKAGKTWGVLAGGRRLAALRLLAGDKAAKGWTQGSKIDCRAIGDDVAAATAITVAENVTQKPMDPLDEFEAFARMMEVGGMDPDGIARTFGVERRRVVERLRYGRVHPDIRAAARAKTINLDAMKAFAEHPDQAVQLDVFEALRGEWVQAWTVRDRLRKRGVKLGDAMAQAVLAEYRAAEGEIAADLIEEDGILCDEALVERLLLARLEAHAAAEASRLGFAWSAGERDVDYKVLQDYGRVYPGARQLTGDEAARCETIANRLAELDEARDAACDDEHEAGEHPDIEAIEAEMDDLNAAYDALTTGWGARDLERAGVLAYRERGEIATAVGLVRPEDRTDRRPEATGGAVAGGMSGTTGDAEGNGVAVALADSLKADLKTERAGVIGTALAADPDLAQDLLLFKTVADLLGRGGNVAYGFGVTASRAERPHGKPDGVDGRAADALADLFAGLDLTWWNDSAAMPERFESFRVLEASMKSRIVAVALADAVKPSDMTFGDALMAHVARQLVPDMRAVWRPTGEAFFGRLKKSVLLDLLARELHQPEEAARLASEKKTAIVDFLERLFAAPFATLTSEQRDAVETWCPPGMEIAAPRERAGYPGETALRGAEPDAEAEDEAHAGISEEIPFEDAVEEAQMETADA